MNTSSLIASLIPASPVAATAPAGSSAPLSASAPSTTESSAQFKAQFDQAVSALTSIAAGTTARTGTTVKAQAATGSGAPSAADALQANLEKKISDLLAAGQSIQQIVQQLAATLANAFAGALQGTAAADRSQLQAAFATALSPPGNGPPASPADLASTLAQRFRQIADVAAGVIGETGQSNRLFAGRFSDAVTAAGEQPAPQPSINGVSADSIASSAAALPANVLTAPGDGKTVASPAPVISSNGDTLLGRILTRATTLSTPLPNPLPAVASSPLPAAAEAASPMLAPTAAVAAAAVNRLLTAATAALAEPAATPDAGAAPARVASAMPSDFVSAAASNALASASSTAATSAAAGGTVAAAAPTIAPAGSSVAVFVRAFTDAFAARDSTPVPPAKPVTETGSATVLPTTVTSSQAPTIGAFAPVTPALHVDAAASNAAQSAQPALQQAPADSNAVIEQILRGAFASTNGTSSTVRLRLVPESLGDVSVRLAINGSSVDASVVAQTPAAHDALVAGQSQLTRALADAGLKLTSFNVSLAGGFSSFQQQQQHSGQQQQAAPARRSLFGGVDTSEPDEAALSAIPSFAPPARTAPGWGVYNYLV